MAHSSLICALITCGLLLSACQSPEIAGICPAYVTYSAQDQKALLSELQAGKEASIPQTQTYRFLRDYGKQRAAFKQICP